MLTRRLAIMAVLIYCFLISSCLSNVRQNTTPHIESDTNLVILAASSLTDAFTELKNLFEEKYPRTNILLNFAGTPTLLTQLELSSSADLFASADEYHISLAQEKGIILASNTTKFATNKLTLITPASSKVVRELHDISNPNTKIILALKNVPLGRYSHASLELMGHLKNSDFDFTRRVLKKVVSQETAARQVLAKIMIGEADAGIVYITDATKRHPTHLNMIMIPDEVNVTAIYSIGIVTNARNHKIDHAQQFIDFIVSNKGQDILRRHGFGKVQQNQ